MSLPRESITGLVLAGGRGSRMGGVDKGLQCLAGQPLAWHALQRLQPQVGPLLVSANRHLDQYAAMGAPVLPDALPDHPGPLAGVLAGLQHCATPWLATVPCDTPGFPEDLVARLADAALAARCDAVVATAPDLEGQLRPQPVFALLRRALAIDLQAYLVSGERRVLPWLRRHGGIECRFDDARAFVNVNTLDELGRLQSPGH